MYLEFNSKARTSLSRRRACQKKQNGLMPAKGSRLHQAVCSELNDGVVLYKGLFTESLLLIRRHLNLRFGKQRGIQLWIDDIFSMAIFSAG